MEKNQINAIVIFGSALIPGSNPQDIDVVFNNADFSFDWTPQNEAIVKKWAEKKGLGHLPIEPHWSFLSSEGRIKLPAPCEVKQPFEILSGPEGMKIQHEAAWNLAAILRVFGNEPERAVAEIKKLATPDPKTCDYGAMVNLVPTANVGDWGNYCMGVKALQSGILKASKWWAIKNSMGVYGDILQKIADGKVSSETIEFFSKRSCGNRSRISIRFDGKSFFIDTEYGDLCDGVTRLSVEKLDELFDLGIKTGITEMEALLGEASNFETAEAALKVAQKQPLHTWQQDAAYAIYYLLLYKEGGDLSLKLSAETAAKAAKEKKGN